MSFASFDNIQFPPWGRKAKRTNSIQYHLRLEGFCHSFVLLFEQVLSKFV